MSFFIQPQDRHRGFIGTPGGGTTALDMIEDNAKSGSAISRRSKRRSDGGLW
jgi:hypothetical protein